MKKYEEGEKGPDGISVENILNRDDNTLPFGYYNPDTEGKLTWICGEGPDGDIISIFSFDKGNNTEKQVKQLENLEQAIFFRDELIKNGWRKLTPPKINFTVSKADGTKGEMNRKQKRALAKKMKEISKSSK